MGRGNGAGEFGRQLRKWRQARRLSQLRLAVDAGVSPRHLSFIETGRSQPSREMVLLLADHLRLPLREQNTMLLAAGFAPAFEQRPLDSPEMSVVRKSVEMVLKGHEPFPAIAVDRKWNVVMSNCGAPLLAEGVSPEFLGAAVNVYRLSLHPNGLRPRVLNFPEYARHMVSRLRHDATISGDAELFELLSEVESYPDMRSLSGASAERGTVALPLRIKSAVGDLSFITMVATFGTPFDVTVSELAIETFFPADTTTARRLRDRSSAGA
jgi:transcriptional regulator with XRE-family HTH domain